MEFKPQKIHITELSEIEKERIPKIINIAEQLSKSLKFVRVDFYIKPEIRIGEFTFYPRVWHVFW